MCHVNVHNLSLNSGLRIRLKFCLGRPPLEVVGQSQTVRQIISAYTKTNPFNLKSPLFICINRVLTEKIKDGLHRSIKLCQCRDIK